MDDRQSIKRIVSPRLSTKDDVGKVRKGFDSTLREISNAETNSLSRKAFRPSRGGVLIYSTKFGIMSLSVRRDFRNMY